MKIKMLVAMLLLSAVVVFAAERQTPAGRREISPRNLPGRTMPDPQQQYQSVMAERGRLHQQEILELQSIKKIAEEEEAEKTAEAIQALIDKKQAQYKKEVEKIEAARRQRTEQLEERTRQHSRHSQPAQEGQNTDTPKTENQQ